MSLYNLPRPWNSGYAIPRYVLAEPPERGTFTTAQLPRGTISEVIPNYLAVPNLPKGAPADALGLDVVDWVSSNPLTVAALAVAGLFAYSRLKKGHRR